MDVITKKISIKEAIHFKSSQTAGLCEGCAPNLRGSSSRNFWLLIRSSRRTRLSRRLQQMDNRAHRIISYDKRICGCDKDSLSKRCEASPFQKIMRFKDHILKNFQPKSLPHHNRLDNLCGRTDRRQRSFFPRMTLLWNQPRKSQSYKSYRHTCRPGVSSTLSLPLSLSLAISILVIISFSLSF